MSHQVPDLHSCRTKESEFDLRVWYKFIHPSFFFFDVVLVDKEIHVIKAQYVLLGTVFLSYFGSINESLIDLYRLALTRND